MALYSTYEVLLQVLGKGEKLVNQFKCGNLTVDLATFTATNGKKQANMTRAEFIVLFHFASNPDRIIDRKEINDILGLKEKSRNLDTMIRRFRMKFGWHVRTAHKAGYSLNEV